MAPRYRVTLTPQERQELQALTRTGKTSGKRFLYARALLLCDKGPDGPGWTVARTAEAMGVTARTVEHLKRRFVEEGLKAALQRKRRQRPPREVTFDGAFEARLIALALLAGAGGAAALEAFAWPRRWSSMGLRRRCRL